MITWFLTCKPWIQFPVFWAPFFAATIIVRTSLQVPAVEAPTIGAPILIAACLAAVAQRAGRAHTLQTGVGQPADPDRGETQRGDA